MDKTPGCVDVAIQVYGKPYQTALTLASLARWSARWIHRVFVIEERNQPEPVDFAKLSAASRLPLVRFRPKHWFGVKPVNALWRMRFRDYRQSFRYQYAWETSDRRFLFLTHNDMLYSGDLIGAYLDRIGGSIGIGMVGQCWNCEAHYAGVCIPERFKLYRPTQAQYRDLLANTRSGPRRDRHPQVDTAREPAWPLPECRLNEFAALINMETARPLSYPRGDVLPFGANIGVDVGSHWFRQVCEMGFDVQHFAYGEYATHAWASSGRPGFEADGNRDLYDEAESRALELLRSDFGVGDD